MKKLFLVALMATTFFACAKTPSRIAPVAVSSSDYEKMSCTKLVQELSAVSAKLEESERKQRNAVAGDAVGVFLVLVPVSAMTGDSEGEVALYKGQKIAVEQAMSRKTCK